MWLNEKWNLTTRHKHYANVGSIHSVCLWNGWIMHGRWVVRRVNILAPSKSSSTKRTIIINVTRVHCAVGSNAHKHKPFQSLRQNQVEQTWTHYISIHIQHKKSLCNCRKTDANKSINEPFEFGRICIFSEFVMWTWIDPDEVGWKFYEVPLTSRQIDCFERLPNWGKL